MIVYNIYVNSNTDKYIFDIVKMVHNTYLVNCRAGDLFIVCGMYYQYKDAVRGLARYMKLAMTNKLLNYICETCNLNYCFPYKCTCKVKNHLWVVNEVDNPHPHMLS